MQIGSDKHIYNLDFDIKLFQKPHFHCSLNTICQIKFFKTVNILCEYELNRLGFKNRSYIEILIQKGFI